MRGLFAAAIVIVTGPWAMPAPTQTPAVYLRPANALQITQGPVIEHLTGTTAVIAWSTNVNAGTELHYGTASDHLDQSAGMPWGGLTHRVELKDLSPGTKYFFRAESPHGQGTGEIAASPVLSFQTKSM